MLTNLVLKKTPGKWRSILHLSYPPGGSVNDYINKDDYSLQYITIDCVISHIKQLGQGCYLSKLDVEVAFRIAPVHPDDWHLLGMKWQGSIILICVNPWVAAPVLSILTLLVKI